MHTPDGSGTDSTSNYVYYDVDITTAGTYNLFLLSNGPDGGSDSFWVSVDSGADFQVTTGSGTAWDWKKPSTTFTLAVGTHRVYVKVREDGARVDKLYLSTSSTAPTGLGGTALPPNYR